MKKLPTKNCENAKKLEPFSRVMDSDFLCGLQNGFPIGLAYASVGIAFGLLVVQNGMPVWVAMLISATNFNSAGQFIGFNLISNGAMFLEIALTILAINLRFSLMSLSLSLRVPHDMTTIQRMALSFTITDEVFVLAMQRNRPLNIRYFSGLFLPLFSGWLAGTLLGAVASDFLPQSLQAASGIIIYSMFISIIFSPASRNQPALMVVFISAVFSCIFYYVPLLHEIPQSWIVILCALITCTFAAIFYPVDESQPGEERI